LEVARACDIECRMARLAAVAPETLERRAKEAVENVTDAVK
jgi:hypothetical protein